MWRMGKDMEKLEHLCVVGKNVHGAATREKWSGRSSNN